MNILILSQRDLSGYSAMICLSLENIFLLLDGKMSYIFTGCILLYCVDTLFCALALLLKF